MLTVRISPTVLADYEARCIAEAPYGRINHAGVHQVTREEAQELLSDADHQGNVTGNYIDPSSGAVTTAYRALYRQLEKALQEPEKAPQGAVRVALYARVSTDRQSTEAQLQALREVAARSGWHVVDEYVDHGISGAKGRTERPQLDRMLRAVVARKVDLVAAWSADRLGRSMTHLVAMLDELHGSGADLYLHQQQLNTRTPAGKALFGMVGVFAEFERSMIRERVQAGMNRTKRTGKNKHGQAVTIGRPKVSEATEARIRELRAEGHGMLKVSKLLGCGVSTVQRVLIETA